MVLLQQGALIQIVPLLFVFDATHNDRDHPPVFDFGGSPQYRAAGYLATSTERSSMQVGVSAEALLHQSPAFAHVSWAGVQPALLGC